MLSSLLITGAALAVEPLLPELSESLPAGFRLDGDPSEWVEAPPSLTLGKLQQSGGPEAIGGPDDYLMQGWWAITPTGLYLAGEVRDDKPLFATTSDALAASDHISVWISLPSAELPPLAFVDESGVHPLDSEDRCDSTEAIQDKAACKEWVGKQLTRRVVLAKHSTRQYTLSPLGVNESFAGSCAPEPTDTHSAGLKPCPDSEFKSRVASNGWTFEARIGLEAFPATGELPLTRMRLLVEAVDNDLGSEAQESTMSLWKGAQASDLATLPSFTLNHPLVSETDPPVLGAVLAASPRPGLMYYPSPRLDRAWILENIAVTGVAAPIAPSPTITKLKLGALPVAAKSGDVVLLMVPDGGQGCAGCAMRRKLVAVQGTTVLGEAAIGGAELKTAVMRGEALHLTLIERGPGLQLDSLDAPGAVTHRITVLSFDRSGVFTELFQEEVPEGIDGLTDEAGVRFAATGVVAEVSADGATVGFKGQRLDSTNLPVGPFVQQWTWDAAAEEYAPVVSGGAASGD